MLIFKACWSDGVKLLDGQKKSSLLSRSAQYSMILQVHKIVDLSEQPDREAMWNLEVIEAHKLFYLTSPE
ncbi:hypothetical protein ZIOFF_054589 [Zingiber officinale]|uniref:Uncharacterized protein n=1 Tax=Zingiber officinale TaxID=94328 RepID=A0A8J5KPF0_ZINOF|nr:hypothetical protein ZIOFF_054589 [Zingiber officinale]